MSTTQQFFKLTKVDLPKNDFTNVSHVKIIGTNNYIGLKLCELCIQQHHLSLDQHAPLEPTLEEAQKNYLKKFYPIQYSRCLGAARAIGFTEGKEPCIFGLPYNLMPTPMCSSIFYPEASTVNKHNYLSRNFDFFTESFCDIVGIPVNTMLSHPPQSHDGRHLHYGTVSKRWWICFPFYEFQ